MRSNCHNRTAGNRGPLRRIGAIVWGFFAFGSAALMIGLGPNSRDAQPHGQTPDGSGAHLTGSPIGWTDSSCNGCHAIDPNFSHPVGFSPDRPLPADFPLQGGKMTCLTCHDGQESRTHTEARAERDPMLRTRFTGQAFCTQCHEHTIDPLKGGHAAAVDKAHLLWPDTPRDRTLSKAKIGLDRESASCLECHDGMVAGAVGGHLSDFSGFGMNKEHPIGMPYQPRGSRDRGMANMVNPHNLDPRIRLFDGAVGCGSCHSVYSDHKHKLVMSNQRSNLCLSCHDG